MRVRELSPSDATVMLQQRLPGIEKHWCQNLVEVLGGHPGILDVTSRYLQSDWAITPQALFDDLLNRPHEAVSDLMTMTGTEPRLSVVVDHILKEGRAGNDLARTVLEVLAWLEHDGELPLTVVEDVIGEWRTEAPSALELAAALSTLERSGLVHLEDGVVSTLPLVASAARSLSGKRAEPIMLAYERMLLRDNQPEAVPHQVAGRQADRRAAWPTHLIAANWGIAGFCVLSPMRSWLVTWQEEERRRATIYRVAAPRLVRFSPDQFCWERVTVDEAVRITRLAFWAVDDTLEDDEESSQVWRALFGDPAYASARETLADLVAGGTTGGITEEARKGVAEAIRNGAREPDRIVEQVELALGFTCTADPDDR